MSTVPKLTYAKIGKGPKGKVESTSSQINRNKDQQSDDLFSHMNQENLKYIQKEIKLKKNRSDQEQPKTNPLNTNDVAQETEQQLTQRDKLYHKYRRNEEVLERESHLQQTQRCNDNQKPLFMAFNDQTNDHFGQRQNLVYQQKNRQVKMFQKRQGTGESKTYPSLPQEQVKKRMVSIQNHFGQAMSTVLNKQDGGQFIEFLEEYISDLNQIIHIKTKPNQESSVQKQHFEQMRSSKQKQSSQLKPVKESRQLDQQIKANMKRLQKIKMSSDTFGQPNNKFSMKSEQMQNQFDFRQLQIQLKQQKLININLAKQIQKYRELLQSKQDAIKKLQVDNELFQEEILHVKKKQEILSRNRKSTENLREFQNIKNQSRVTKHFNNQNIQQKDNGNLHYRNASANAQKAAMSYRSSFKVFDDFAELFQNSNNNPQKEPRFRQKKRKENDSLERLQRQYGQFLDSQKRDNRYKRGSRRTHQLIY